MKWSSWYETTRTDLREEQLKRIYPVTHFKKRKATELRTINRNETAARVERTERRGNICGVCHEAKSAIGSCACEE